MTREKKNGIHYTPDDLALFLAEQVVRQVSDWNRDIRVLDPACGDGQLLDAFAQAAPKEARERLTLIGFDTDAEAVREAHDNLSRLGVKSVEVKAADFLSLDKIGEKCQGALFREGPIEPPGDVDIVISNPPYVRTQILGARESQRLAKRFELTGRVDLYHAFTIAMLSILKRGGVLGLLTSNRFLLTKAGASMRRTLQDSLALRTLIDLGDTKLFEAAVLPAIVIGKKSSAGNPDGCEFVRVYENKAIAGEGAAPEYASVLDALRKGKDGAVRTPAGRFSIEKGALASAPDASRPWFLATATIDDWLKKVYSKASMLFGDVAEIRVGIKTTADSVFIREDWGRLPDDIRPEKSLLHPLLTHHIAERWKLSVDVASIGRRVLYPHEEREGRKRPIDLDAYPKAERYLESHRRTLEGRTYVIEARRRWYEIWVPQNPADWSRHKVVCPDISVRPCFFLDREGAIVNGDCYWTTLRPGHEENWLLLILAVANSTFIERFYDTKFHNKLYSGRRRFITQYIKEFPLPDIGSEPAVKAMALTKELISTAGAQEAQECEEAVDRAVWESFGLIKEIVR